VKYSSQQTKTKDKGKKKRTGKERRRLKKENLLMGARNEESRQQRIHGTQGRKLD